MKREYSKYGQEGGTEWFELPSEIAVNFTQECKRIEDIFIGLIKSGNPFI
jgi:hypothetical protein